MSRLAGLSAIALCAAALSGPASAVSLKLGGGGGLLGTGLLSGGSDSGGGAAVTVGGGANSTPGVSLGLGVGGTGVSVDAKAGVTDDLFGGNGSVIVDLFGNGGDSGDAQVGLGVNVLGVGDDDSGTGGSVTLDLFGDGTDTATAAPLVTAPATANVTGGALEQAGGVSCFNPSPAQLARLAARHAYAAATFQTWTGAAVVKVIDASVCPAAATKIGADPNIGRLRAYISGNATLRANLTQWGHDAGDVIAVDRQGRTLIFYVA